MSDDQTKSKPNPFKRKKLTPFLAHEMIYDFATGALEPDRAAALEEFIAKDQESQTLLANLKNAQSHVEKLKATQVDAEILSHLLEAESAVSLGRRYSSWREWPETLRWSLTAIALSALVAGGVGLVPWARFAPKKSINSENVEVAQIPQTKPEDAEQVAANEDRGSGDEPPDDASGEEASGDDVADSSGAVDGSGDEEDSAPAAGSKAAATKSKANEKLAGLAAAPTPSPSPAKPAVPPESLNKSAPNAFFAYFFPPKPKTTPTPAPTATPTQVAALDTKPVSKSAPTPVPSPTPGTNASSQVTMGETADTHDIHDPKAKGFVYRAFMTLENLEEIGPKLTADIIALGGEKAGEVELGWKRGSGRYYHFILPETNEKKILERLQVYGPVRISKDPHPRVMPPGQVRFILWVESASN